MLAQIDCVGRILLLLLFYIFYINIKEGSNKEWHANISGENSEGEMLKNKTTIYLLML